MSSSAEKSVGPVLFDLCRGGSLKKPGFSGFRKLPLSVKKYVLQESLFYWKSYLKNFIFKKCHYIGNGTLWTASSRSCGHTKFYQNPASVAIFREKSEIFKIVFYWRSYFIENRILLKILFYWRSFFTIIVFDFFGKSFIFKKSRYIGNSTLWSASSRSCGHTKFHQNLAYVALFRDKY